MTRRGPECSDVEDLDRRDPLRAARDLFELPEGLLYFDGNSLGPLPRGVRERLADVVERQWGADLIRSWNVHGWVDMPRRVAAKVAPLVGADADEIAVTDSTSVNLFKLLASALSLAPSIPPGGRSSSPARSVILSDREQFPTDLYVAEGLAALLGRGHTLELVEGDEDAIEGTLASRPDVAVLYLSHVRFKSGRLLDMERLTRAAHDAGALVLWDLSHSAGALPVDLGGCGADFAVGCGYKFLNGGPGAPAYLYVARRHHASAVTPIAGWFGHARPFAFATAYEPAPGVDRFLCGTAPILSLAALEAALDVFDGVDLAALRQKSLALGDLFIELVEAAGAELRLISPPGDQRGSQVSYAHPDAYAVAQALIDRGVVPDFREPDVLRFGLSPLYMRYSDVRDGVEILVDVLRTQSWGAPRYHRRRKVT